MDERDRQSRGYSVYLLAFLQNTSELHWLLWKITCSTKSFKVLLWTVFASLHSIFKLHIFLESNNESQNLKKGCPTCAPVYAQNGTDCLWKSGLLGDNCNNMALGHSLIISAYRLFWSRKRRLSPWAARDWCLYREDSFYPLIFFIDNQDGSNRKLLQCCMLRLNLATPLPASCSVLGVTRVEMLCVIHLRVRAFVYLYE